MLSGPIIGVAFPQVEREQHRALVARLRQPSEAPNSTTALDRDPKVTPPASTDPSQTNREISVGSPLTLNVAPGPNR